MKINHLLKKLHYGDTKVLIMIMLIIGLVKSQSTDSTTKTTYIPSGYKYGWKQLSYCNSNRTNTQFPTMDFYSGISIANKAHPWANQYISRFKQNDDEQYLRNAAWRGFRRRMFDIISIIIIFLLLIYSCIYFTWRGCKRAKRKKEKTKNREQLEKMSEFEKGVLERKRQNRKRCCFIEFLRYKRIQQFLCFTSLAMVITSLVLIFRLWSFANDAFSGLQAADCAFHRLLQYLEQGEPPINPLDAADIKRRSLYGGSIGYFGLNNYKYFLSQVKDSLKDSKIITATITDQVERSQQVIKGYKDTASIENKVKSCTKADFMINIDLQV